MFPRYRRLPPLGDWHLRLSPLSSADGFVETVPHKQEGLLAKDNGRNRMLPPQQLILGNSNSRRPVPSYRESPFPSDLA
jgi:hypothetical protein